jgi:hypothetical protein
LSLAVGVDLGEDGEVAELDFEAPLLLSWVNL